MSSTRNLNTIHDYTVKKNESKKITDYMLYNGYANNNNPALFVRGPNPSMYADQLSYNAIDIESTLRGIRSTNLEGPSFKADPVLKTLNETEYFKVEKTYLPKPFLHYRNERPLYLN